MAGAPAPWSRETAAHLFHRAAAGASPSEIEQAVQDGFEATLERLMRDEADDDLFPEPPVFGSGELVEKRRNLARLPEDSQERREARQELRRAEGAALLDLKAWWITRLRYSPCSVRETMTLFWHGHFATSFEKVQSAEAMLRQNHLFRNLGMGRFEDLTLAVSRDAAMMRYLDLAGSSKKQPNENFARELLELFTLGEGNYTEADVREVARAFTGWRIEPATGAIRFDPSRFDGGPKTVLGETGPLGAPECVRVICHHPQCARFLTAKLWEFFAGGPPPPEVAKKLEEVFRAAGGSLRQVLETVFRAPEFYGPDVRGRRIKSPAEWLVGTLKSLNLPPPPAAQTAATLRELGQNLFAPPNVKGWEGGRAWISATTLLARQRLALDLFLPVPPSLVPEEARQSPERLAAHAAGVLMPAGIPEQVVKAACSALASEPFPATSTTCNKAFQFFLTTPEFQTS